MLQKCALIALLSQVCEVVYIYLGHFCRGCCFHHCSSVFSRLTQNVTGWVVMKFGE